MRDRRSESSCLDVTECDGSIVLLELDWIGFKSGCVRSILQALIPEKLQRRRGVAKSHPHIFSLVHFIISCVVFILSPQKVIV